MGAFCSEWWAYRADLPGECIVMALAIPWGALADRIGRKKVLAVGFFGSILHILWFLVVCSLLPAAIDQN